MFSIKSNDFLNNLLSFDLTLQSRFSCFCIFLTLRDLSNVKWTKYFCHIIFLGNRRSWEEVVNVQRHGGKTGAPCGPLSWPRGGAHLPLVGPIDANFASTESSWPKIDYKRDPHAISLWGGGETRNTQYGFVDCEDRREILPEPLLVAPSPPSTLSPSTPW
jgi:hypothetical protein